MSPKDVLTARLQARSARIGIIGLGYVGLPLALTYSNAGYAVLGMDIDEDKVHTLNHGQSYIERISPASVTHAREYGFQATTDFSLAATCDALIICVPTPLSQHREPDLSFVISTIESITPYLREGQVVSLESTTYPGTTEEELKPRIESQGLKVGEDVFLIYSPEREDPGNSQYETRTIPKVVGGQTSACLEVGKALYQSAIEQVVAVSSTRAAEMTKLLENIHRAVNIGLVNEMKLVADRMGVDIFEVIDAAATKPFGFTPYYPGPGLGGHCIPIDPYYLTWKAREYGINTRFIELSGEINRAMPEYVVRKLIDGLNRHSKPLNGSRILILGISYKKNVDDMRESPAVEIMQRIQDLGGVISYCDPHVPVFPTIRKANFELSSVELTRENLTTFDAVVLTTNHDSFDYSAILEYANLIIDTRGVYRAKRHNVIHA
ncbi:nucleotide sugar dehydrogenase [Microbulbifer sp. YPW16]|uniref:nucleotide sugar dehydrogenase n=1 Tax=Microbulbifer sp. YPW16 TaxID=2904242 RepID=UPI001E3F2D7F|nr:nucleotide sugar dehydrogenase [Microbulbifer sp. YPW16]UHQ54877.1 nucleotide sugar dehydrogenase [Microbulbifer sp. YPW16]